VQVQAKKAKRYGEYILKLLDMTCELLPEFTAANSRAHNEIKMPLGKDSYMLVDGEYMNEFDTMEAIQCVDLNDADVETYGRQVVDFRGKFDRDLYRREDLATKKLINRLYEEQKKKQAKKKVLQVRKSLVNTSRSYAQQPQTSLTNN